MIDGAEILERLPEGARRLLAGVGEIAAGREEEAYLVGGTVRDLILGRPGEDLDVVVVGDGMAVAQAAARAWDGELTRYHAFQTATVLLPGGGRIDFATARGEDYPTPGQLPRVRAGTLEEDLARRDFTINSVALGLPPSVEAAVVDPFAGRRDMEGGWIRILHEGSFVDDPTRMLRAVRFALRFGYRLAERTAVALADAVRGGNLGAVSGDRLRREVAKILAEAPVRGPVTLAARGLLASLHPQLEADATRLDRLQVEVSRYREGLEPGDAPPDPTWPLTLALLARPLSAQARWEPARRLRLSREERLPLLESGGPWAEARERLERYEAPDLADAVEALEGLSDATLVVVLAALGEEEASLRELIRAALVRGRRIVPLLDGDDLVALGCEPGPGMGEVLRRLRRARIEGRVEDAEGEREMARRLLADRR